MDRKRDFVVFRISSRLSFVIELDNRSERSLPPIGVYERTQSCLATNQLNKFPSPFP